MYIIHLVYNIFFIFFCCFFNNRDGLFISWRIFFLRFYGARLSFRIFSSETYDILDCGFYDDGSKSVVTTTSATGGWCNVGGNLNVQTSSDCKTATNTDGTARHLFYHDTIISTTKVGAYNSLLNNSAIEFEVTDYIGTPDVYLTDGSNNRSLNIKSNGTYKIVLDGSNVHLFIDNEEQTLTGSTIMNGSNIRFSFLLNALNESISFRNFMIYPI